MVQTPESVRVLLGAIILCTFIILGVMAFAIMNTNNRIDESINTVQDGVGCIMGFVLDEEHSLRPRKEQILETCADFILEVEENGNQD